MKRLLVLLISVAILFSLAGCCLSHEWVDATCTTPKTCSECGKTDGTILPHAWIAATCTTLKTCSVCAITEGELLPHAWNDATCSVPQTCSVCSATEGDVLPHTWIAASCQAPQTCSACHEELGDILDHTVSEWHVAKEPTCTNVGIENGSCVYCNNVQEREIPMLDHIVGDWVVIKEPTSSEKGQQSKSCTVCNTVVETEEFDLSAEQKEAEYKASCGSYAYKDIARNPDTYKGKHAVFTGEVIQVQQEELYGLMFYVLRVDVTKSGSYYTDTVYVTYCTTTSAPRILEDDIIVMYGELTGEKTYTTVMGASVTIPSFSAEYIDIK